MCFETTGGSMTFLEFINNNLGVVTYIVVIVIVFCYAAFDAFLVFLKERRKSSIFMSKEVEEAIIKTIINTPMSEDAILELLDDASLFAREGCISFLKDEISKLKVRYRIN
jgi:hypothetical protein